MNGIENLSEVRLTENALRVLEKRYLKKDDRGNPTETPKDLFWRVAFTIADEDVKYGASADEVQQTAVEFYNMMAEGRFMPNSPTLMNAGRPLGQLSACFVLPVKDALANGKDGIYDTLTTMALIHQSGGGTGFSFSNLRPKGSVVRSTTGVASGPVSFMTLYDASTEVVKQGGTRRGANMGILRVDHPDILEFIRCKEDTSKITNFNISVAVTDAFMRAVRDGTKYALVDNKGNVREHADARTVFDEIVKHAWATGEPGVFFIDRANEHNPVPHLGDYEATNPCGEQPLLPYDVCNLGSVNVGAFVDPYSGAIDFAGMTKTITSAVHFLDNVIDANKFPVEQIADLSKRIRRIGLGVMGFADALVRQNMAYGSEESIAFADMLADHFCTTAHLASSGLASRRGVFPEWEQSVWGPDETCARNNKGARIRPMHRLRNCNVTTIAPTGTISMLADCSGGIEPLFAVAFMRNQAGMRMREVNKDFLLQAHAGGWYKEELMQRIAETGHIHHEAVPPHVQRTFVTAHDVTPEQHVRMQAAFQRYVDSAISKTCNFPETATKEDVAEIYQLAYSLGCKGVTVYRDNSRPEQILSTGVPKAAPEKLVEKPAAHPAPRPKILHGFTEEVHTPAGRAFFTVNEQDGKPFEVFVTLGKAGTAVAAFVESLGRLASLALRSGVDVRDLVVQLRGITQEDAVGFGPNRVLSVPDALAQVLQRRYFAEQSSPENVRTDLHTAVNKRSLSTKIFDFEPQSGYPNFVHKNGKIGVCAECDASLVHLENCEKCPYCGWSKCG